MTSVTNIQPSAQAREIGFGIKNGGIITIDVPLSGGIYFKMLHIGSAGDLLVKGIDGNIIPFRGLLSGSWVPVWGSMVVSTATVDGVVLGTSVTDIDWYGGV